MKTILRHAAAAALLLASLHARAAPSSAGAPSSWTGRIPSAQAGDGIAGARGDADAAAPVPTRHPAAAVASWTGHIPSGGGALGARFEAVEGADASRALSSWAGVITTPDASPGAIGAGSGEP